MQGGLLRRIRLACQGVVDERHRAEAENFGKTNRNGDLRVEELQDDVSAILSCGHDELQGRCTRVGSL